MAQAELELICVKCYFCGSRAKDQQHLILYNIWAQIISTALPLDSLLMTKQWLQKREDRALI